MSFDECELAILRTAVDTAQEKIAKRVVSSPAIKDMTVIVENFIKKKGLIPYGGIAINNVLPKDDQFYDEETDIPDYDFFSPNAMDDAKKLADIYHANINIVGPVDMGPCTLFIIEVCSHVNCWIAFEI